LTGKPTSIVWPLLHFSLLDAVEDFAPVDRNVAWSFDTDPCLVTLDPYQGDDDVVVDVDLLANFA
jgi:hypothetical protein